MPDAQKYIKFLTPSQINKIISSGNPVEISFSNAQLKKMMQEGGLGFNLLGPLLRNCHSLSCQKCCCSLSQYKQQLLLLMPEFKKQYMEVVPV